MLKTRILLCAISLAATAPLHGEVTIDVGKLTKTQLREAIKTAPDDAVIEFQGVKKTKAEWRSQERAKYRPMDPAKLKELERQRNAMVEARQKALDDEQDSRVEAENARTMVKFKELRLRQTANGRQVP